MGFINNILTGKDNKTHDVVRVSIAIVAASLPVVMFWGIGLETWAVLNQKVFDMNAFFLGIGAFLTLYGGFLTGAATAIYLKRNT